MTADLTLREHQLVAEAYAAGRSDALAEDQRHTSSGRVRDARFAGRLQGRREAFEEVARFIDHIGAVGQEGLLADQIARRCRLEAAGTQETAERFAAEGGTGHDADQDEE